MSGKLREQNGGLRLLTGQVGILGPAEAFQRTPGPVQLQNDQDQHGEKGTNEELARGQGDPVVEEEQRKEGQGCYTGYAAQKDQMGWSPAQQGRYGRHAQQSQQRPGKAIEVEQAPATEHGVDRVGVESGGRQVSRRGRNRASVRAGGSAREKNQAAAKRGRSFRGGQSGIQGMERQELKIGLAAGSSITPGLECQVEPRSSGLPVGLTQRAAQLPDQLKSWMIDRKTSYPAIDVSHATANLVKQKWTWFHHPHRRRQPLRRRPLEEKLRTKNDDLAGSSLVQTPEQPQGVLIGPTPLASAFTKSGQGDANVERRLVPSLLPKPHPRVVKGQLELAKGRSLTQ